MVVENDGGTALQRQKCERMLAKLFEMGQFCVCCVAAGEQLWQIFGAVGVQSRWVAYLHYHLGGARWQWVEQLHGPVEESGELFRKEQCC